MRNHVTAAAVLGIAALGITSVVDLRAQQALQSPVGISVPFSASAGAGFVTGELRITQFAEQNGQPVAIGTLGLATDNSGAPGTEVTQVVVPVLAVASTSTGASMAFGRSAARPTTPGTPTGTAIEGTTGSFGAAAAPTSSTPGTQANCGPLRIELGPLDLGQALTGLQIPRLVVDVAAPQGSVTTVNSLVCAADAALASAAAAGTGGGDAATAAIGSAQPGGAVSGTGGTTQAAVTATPLQGLVASLNQVLAGL